jgi:hypothetical protein
MLSGETHPRVCAYCGEPSRLTREHLIPNSLMDRTPEYDVKYLEAAKSFVKGQPTVRDVCSDCNNGALSSLDNYALELYKQYFGNIVEKHAQLVFEYDFHRLVRWLLKVSYNSARTKDEEDATLLALFRGYILGTERMPTRCAVFMQLLIPVVIARQDETRFNKALLDQLPLQSNGQHCIVPKGFMLSRSKTREHFRNVLVRRVLLNSYNFILMIPKTNVVHPKVWKEKRHQLQDAMKGTRQLAENATHVKVTASGADILAASMADLITKKEMNNAWLREYLKTCN